MTHLWEVDHDFYGAEQCYYANMYQQAEWNREFDSWAEFAEDSDSLYSVGDDGGYSIGMNWLYRWDWDAAYPADLEEGEYSGDMLKLFFIFPGRGMIGMTEIKVTEEDEPAVREWLQKFADYMKEMWAPII